MKGVTQEATEPSKMTNNHQVLWRQYTAAICANLGIMNMGLNLAYTAPVSPILMSGSGPFQITELQNSWFTSIFNIGAMLGSIVAHIFLHRLGRRGSLLSMGGPLILGWIILAAAQNFTMLLIGRLVQGVCIGVLVATVPPYVGEISATSIRGRLGSLFGMSIAVGILYMFVVSALINDFRWISGLCVPIALLYVISVFFFALESPAYLLEKGKDTEAMETIQKLNGPKYDISSDFQMLKSDVDTYGKGGGMWEEMSRLKSWDVLKPLLLIFCIQIFQQVTGVNAVTFNLNNILESSGANFSVIASTISIALVQVVTTSVSAPLMDIAGRKTMLTISFTLCGMSLLFLGLYFHLLGMGTDSVWAEWTTSNLWWLPILTLIVFITSFCMGAVVVGYIFVGEFFTPDVRMISSCAVSFVTWFSSFLVTLSYASFRNGLGSAGVWWLYAVCCFCAVAFTVFLVPETKGKSFQEITAYFKNGKFSRNNEKSVNIVDTSL